MKKAELAGIVAATALMTLPLTGFAAGGPAGKNEVSGSVSYNDIGYSKLTAVDLSYGRYLTDMHEVGLTVSYVDMESEGTGADGTMLGGFYHLNFPVDGILTSATTSVAITVSVTAAITMTC